MCALAEPPWWYGGSAVVAEVSVELKPVQPPFVTPLPSDEVPAKRKPQLSLFNPAEKADALPLPPTVLEKLTTDEKSILVLLRETGSARGSELAERLQKNPGRFNGLMVALRRKLHAAGHVLFSDERLPSGEAMYRYQSKEGR